MDPIHPEETIRVSHFINESERNATPANDEGKIPKLEADGKLSEAFVQSLLASGTSTTLSVTTKVDTRLLVIAKGDLTINGTGSVTVSYDGVEKDRNDFNTSGQNGVQAPFFLMFIHTPGVAQTKNVTLSGGSNIKIAAFSV